MIFRRRLRRRFTFDAKVRDENYPICEFSKRKNPFEKSTIVQMLNNMYDFVNNTNTSKQEKGVFIHESNGNRSAH